MHYVALWEGGNTTSNTKAIVDSGRYFILDITKSDTNLHGFVKLEYLYNDILCELNINIVSNIQYNVTKGIDYIDRITFNKEGNNIVFCIIFKGSVSGVKVVEMPIEFGTINSLTTGTIMGKYVAMRNDIHSVKEVDNSLFKVFNNQDGESAKWIKVVNAISQNGKSYTVRLQAQKLTHTGHIECVSAARENDSYNYSGLIELQERVVTGELPSASDSSFLVVDANGVLWLRLASYSYATVELFTPNVANSFVFSGIEGTPVETYKLNMLSKRRSVEVQQRLDIIGDITLISGDDVVVEPGTVNDATTLASVTLDAGVYVVVSSANFPNATTLGNYRRACLVQSENTISAAKGVTHSCSPASGITTSLQIFSILKVTSPTTYYLNVQHDAGSTLKCNGQIRAVRLE